MSKQETINNLIGWFRARVSISDHESDYLKFILNEFDNKASQVYGNKIKDLQDRAEFLKDKSDELSACIDKLNNKYKLLEKYADDMAEVMEYHNLNVDSLNNYKKLKGK